MNVRAYWYIQFLKQVWQNSPTYGGWKPTGGDTFKMALFTNAYSPNQDIHATKANLSNEVDGQGYAAGGQILTNKTISASTGQLILGADSVAWTNCVFTARWAVIYDDTNSSVDQKQLVRFVDFGGDISLSGHTLRITFDGLGVIVDVTEPVDNEIPSWEAISVNGPLLTIIYNEALDTSSVPSTSDFGISVDGSSRSVSSIAMTSGAVVLTLSSAVVSTNEVLVSYTAPASSPIQDLAGNRAISFSGIEANNVTPPDPPPADVTPPALQAASINGAVLTLDYNENLSPASVPLTSAFQVFYSGISRNINSVTIQDDKVVLAMAVAATAANIVTLNYTAGAAPVEDLAGNNAANLSNQDVTNNTPGDSTPPSLTGLSVNSATLTLNYNEPLISSSVPTTSAYGITVNGTLRSVTIISISQATVTLTLSSAVLDNSLVRASYTAPATNPIRDLAGNNALNFLDLPVTNATPPSVPTDVASFVSQSVPSVVMQANSTQSVSVAMRNDGTAVWTSAAGYHLYSQNPSGTTRWGPSQVPVTGSILQGSNAVFPFTITAPDAAGSYNFQWRMRHTTTEFGAQSSNVVITVGSPPPSTVTVYVSKTGSDFNPGTNEQPFLTVGKGISVLTSGGTLVIRGGIYAESNLGRTSSTMIPSGVNNAQHTTVMAETDRTVTFRPSTGGVGCLTISSRNFITARGIIFDAVNLGNNATYFGRMSTTSGPPSSFIRIINCNAVNARTASGGAGFSIGTNQDGLGGNISLIDCIAYNNGATGDNHTHGVYSSSPNNVIQGGEYYDNSGHGIHFFAHDVPGGNDGVSVSNTRCHGNGSFGIGIYNCAGGALCYNNLVYGNGITIASGGMAIRFAASAVQAYHNTIYANTGRGMLISSGVNTIRNNILRSNTTGTFSDSTSSTKTNNLEGTDPLFVDEGAADFHLQAGSPAINGGFDVSSVLQTDFDGVVRGQPFDIGAYEFVS